MALIFVGVLSWAAGAAAQDEDHVVGKVATLEGLVEIGRSTGWQAAAFGSDIRTGDQIRTGTPGRVRLIFHDDSVITVGDGSLLKIDMSVFSPTAGPMEFVLDLIVGKIRALVSDYYREPLASFQIETATAVSAVRSTEFVVAYNQASQFTEVLGLGGVVAVHGTIDRKNHGVDIKRLTITKVEKGKYPTIPVPIEMDSATYSRLMSGLDFIAEGQPESLARRDPIVKDTPDPGTGATQPWKDAPPAADVPDAMDRTPGEIIDQPTAPLSGNGDAEVEF